MAMLMPLGIEKGKPFQPDARQTAILEEAAALGDAMARNVMYENTQRISEAKPFPDTQWDWVICVKPSQETENYSQLDERLQYTYGAIYLSPAIGVMKAGPGATYVQTFRDKDGDHFDGGRSYRLHVPANPPVSAFWSLTLYDTATRSMVQNPTNDAARSGYDELKTNADGSFGPVLRAQSAGRPGEQLDRDGPRPGVLPDVPLLQPHRAAVRRHLDAAGRRTDITSPVWCLQGLSAFFDGRAGRTASFDGGGGRWPRRAMRRLTSRQPRQGRRDREKAVAVPAHRRDPRHLRAHMADR